MTIALNEAAEAPGPASGARSRRRFTGRDAAAVVADPSSARPLSSVVDEPGRLRTNQSVGMAVIDLGSETGIDLTPQSGNYLFSPVRVPAPVEPAHKEPEAPGRGRVLVATLVRSLAFLCAWGVAVTVAAHVHPIGPIRTLAIFGHLIGLVCGFGAVLALDWYGLACLTGRRSPVEAARLSTSLDPLIWGGLFALMATGSLLAPHLSHPLTRVKLAAVLVAGLNGVNARGLRDAVSRLRPSATLRELPSRLLWRLFITATVSQLAWWTAIVIGFRNTPHN